MKRLRILFAVVDVGFVLYWIAAVFGLFPTDILFKDYTNPILQAWNYSFLPLDLCVSASGVAAIVGHARSHPSWQTLAIVSLVLTFCSGLQALAFWSLRRDFDFIWWAPNLFLLIYPLVFLLPLLRSTGRALV